MGPAKDVVPGIVFCIHITRFWGFFSSSESSLCYLFTYQAEYKLCQYVAQGHFQSWGNLLVLLEGNESLYSKVNFFVFRTNIPGN